MFFSRTTFKTTSQGPEDGVSPGAVGWFPTFKRMVGPAGSHLWRCPEMEDRNSWMVYDGKSICIMNVYGWMTGIIPMETTKSIQVCDLPGALLFQAQRHSSCHKDHGRLCSLCTEFSGFPTDSQRELQ